MKKLFFAAAMAATLTATAQSDSIPAKKESGFTKFLKALDKSSTDAAARQKAMQDSVSRANMPCGTNTSIVMVPEATASLPGLSEYFSYLPAEKNNWSFTSGKTKCYRPDNIFTFYPGKYLWIMGGELWILETPPANQNRLLVTVLDGTTYQIKYTKPYTRRF